jgi:hypothetical protein
MPSKREYKTIVVSSGWGLDLDTSLANVTAREGRSGWRVESILSAEKNKAHVQFSREA